MSTIVRVPPELESFLRLPNPQSLVIRGPPGSGKTMLSIALMESYPGRRVYVSLRGTRDSLLDHVPWLGKIPPGQVEIIDVAAESDQVQDHAPSTESSIRFLGDKEETKDLTEFLWLPRAVQTAWSLSDDRTPTMMVFDSWDAIIDQFFERAAKPAVTMPSRPEIERHLLRRMSKGNISLVLVLEREQPSVLDYHVDGIVDTYRLVEEGRLERWLSLPKLRGVPIPTDTYPFTLAHGRFSAITPTTQADRFHLAPPAPDPTPDAAGLWPGSTDFADGMGRLQFGAVSLFELDSAVPRELTRVIIGPMIIQTLRLGGRVLVIPPPSLDPEDSYLSLEAHVSAEVISSQLRILTAVPLAPEREGRSGAPVPYHRVAWTKSRPSVPVPDDPDFLRGAERSEGANLIVAYLSGLEALADSAAVPMSRGVLAALAMAVFPRSPVHVTAVGRTGEPMGGVIYPVSDLHLKIRCPHGRIFVNGHRPYLAPMVLSQKPGEEPYHLTQIL